MNPLTCQEPFMITIVDRLALASMFVAITAIPFASTAQAYALERAPSAKLSLRDGVERRFYTTGPFGTTTDRVDVSPSGEVLARAQVLDDAVFQSIGPGMTADDVFALIGPPSAKARFPGTATTAWDYHYRDNWGYDAEFSVTVDDAGRVVGKFSGREGD
jgi:outer membrane protein assembly factor BamE (lipoprotein component of BamABCDE complex)